MWTWILGAILVLMVLILLLPLTTVVKFNWNKENHGFLVEVIPGLRSLKFKKSWDLKDILQGADKIEDITADSSRSEFTNKDSGKKTEKKASPGLRQLFWAWYWWNSKAARRRFKRIHMRSLIWETSFSTGDVALTGVATGMVWALKGWMLGITSSRITLEKVKVDVWPTWDHSGIQTRLDCIVRTRLVHIIGIGMSAAWYYLRYRRLAK